MGRILGLGLAIGALAVSGCAWPNGGGGSSEAPSIPVPDVPDTRPVATSGDGRHTLRLDGIHWSEFPSHLPRGLLLIFASLVNPDPNTLLASEDPRSSFLDEDGRELVHEGEEDGHRFTWAVESAENWFGHALEVGTKPTHLALASYRVSILRVGSWESVTAPIAGVGATVPMEASAFRVSVESGPQVCRVTIRGGIPGVLDCSWAQGALEVSDPRGARLECIQGQGGPDSWVFDLVSPKADGAAGVPLRFPLEVRLRVPREYAVHRVPFDFHDVLLPPRPGDATTAEDLPPGFLRSAWSESRDGIALRLSLPAAVLRGDRVDGILGGSIDPAGRLARVFSAVDPAAADRIRLVLRNRESGTTVELRPCADPVDPGRPGDTPESAGGLREWPIRFALATAWDAIVPGTWEARATLEVPPDPDAPAAWSGTLATGPIPFVVEERPVLTDVESLPRSSVNRHRLEAPTALRLRPGEAPGTVEIAFGPRDAEVIEVEVRNGFRLGVGYGEEEERGGSCGYPGLCQMPDVIDALDREVTGPIDRTYVVEVYEGPPEDGGGMDVDRENHRTLWKRSFRVTASEEELQALRR